MNFNRREFLATSSAAAAGLAAGCTTAPQPVAKSGYIDAHVHVWTPDTTAYPLAEDYTKDRMKPPSYTPEELFAQCRPHGVSRIVLIQMSYYKFDNSYMLDMMRKHEGAFGGVAIVDETKREVGARMRDLMEQGVRGFRLYTWKDKAELWQNSAGMKEMWKTGADSNLSMCLLANPDALTNVHAMCSQYPETPVVIDHFARIGISGKVDQEQLDQLLALSKFKTVHVKTSAFYALGKKKPPYTDLGPMIRQLRDAYGAERLMWATDCPYQSGEGHGYGPSLELIRDRLDFLSDSDKEWMLRKTAEKVFFS
ncbi:MAG: amidohydrolase [Verrucomicrobiales bacterium]|nr:amidohydrolase [Verrucomicrobiales bacterium]